MFRPRVIPCLLLKGDGLVKTTQFKAPRYIGDPINAVHIFNAKKADELIFLDISATKENRIPPIELLKKIGDECYMPFSVGGGIRSIKTIRKILKAGAEKVIIGTYAVERPEFIKEASDTFGKSTISVCIDVKRKFFGGYKVMTYSGTKSTKAEPVALAQTLAEMGAGEIVINSIDNDGTMGGYDVGLIRDISDVVRSPVIALGGCGKIQDFQDIVFKGNASAVAAGSFFVFHGKRKAVLISFPTSKELFGIWRKE